MKISETMDLDFLIERASTPITPDEAEVLRSLLANKFDGVDIADVPQLTWDQYLSDSIVF